MKFILALIAVSSLSFAQNVGVKVDDVNANENTTIEIKKGNKATTTNQYEITQGEDNIQGEPAPLLKEARANWTKACNDWKKEFKDLNKENSIISMSCGTQNCATQTMETTCTSTAKYKLKVKVN
jgi:hypothetical protein